MNAPSPTTTNSHPLLRAVGDSAILVEFGAEASRAANNAAIAFERRLRKTSLKGMIETAPTIRSVLVRFDPLECPPQHLVGELETLLASENWLSSPPLEGRKLWRIPALYGGEAGPDLGETSRMLNLDEASAIKEHAAQRHSVTMLGFAPGFTYLDGLPERWNLPRLSHVKPEVPAGSISVAIRQTVMSATRAPTGWRTIARTAFCNFDVNANPPFRIEAGDEIQFEPVSAQEHERLMAVVAQGGNVAKAELIT